MKYRQSTPFNVYAPVKEKGCQLCGKNDSKYYISSKDGFLCSACYRTFQLTKQAVKVTPSRKLVRKGKHA